MLRKPNDLDLKHTRHSHPSKFRILLRRAKAMDGRHSLFAQIVKGLDVARKLRKGDVIYDLIVYVR